MTTQAQAAETTPETAIATFAGGCFWCMEPPFDALEGVLSTTSGYTAGKTPEPSYAQVSAGHTGHAEALQVVFDPQKITYEELLNVYWHNVDPTQENGQFCDIGSQYRTGIYTHGAQQKAAAEASFAHVQAQLGVEIFTEIKEADVFYPAEDYHQNYYQKNPIRYKYYRHACGRDKQLQRVWEQ